jgi:hypothetical protein
MFNNLAKPVFASVVGASTKRVVCEYVDSTINTVTGITVTVQYRLYHNECTHEFIVNTAGGIATYVQYM